jgi:hypothetical protein
MSIGIGENLTGSFGFAKDKLVGSIVNWILLIILTIIPIVNFIAMGTYLKVYRGEDPKVEHIGKSFVDGLLALIIAIIYMLIPLIVTSIVFAASMGSMMADPFAGLAAAGIGGIICLILFILFALLMIPAMINFARKGFGAAFKFGEIFGMIGKAGWLKYIISIILLAIIFGIIGLLGMIPFIGWLIMLIIYPFLIVWAAKFWANLFE